MGGLDSMKIKERIKAYIKKIPGVTTVRSLQIAFRAPLKVIIESHRKIKKFEKAYQGKRCFIIGNGPSLTPDDLDLIKNEVCFAANTIYKIFPYTKWRPTFYCIQDEKVLMDIAKDNLKDKTKECIATFVRMYSNRIVRKENIELNNIIFVPIWGRLTSRYSAPFSERADKVVYDGSMVTYLSIQLAVYMGFEKIYLLGMDHNFPYRRNRNDEIEVNDTTVVAHFWEKEDKSINIGTTKFRANYHELAENSYREAEAFSQKSGRFRIYNATRGGKLEVFERVNLESIINGGID